MNIHKTVQLRLVFNTNDVTIYFTRIQAMILIVSFRLQLRLISFLCLNFYLS